MRLIFDRNFKFRGFSESLENIVLGTIGLWSNLIGTFLAFLIAPIFTYHLIRLARKAKPEDRRSQWNPLRNPIPFIIINICWLSFVCCIVFGKAFEKENLSYKPKTFWDFKDPNHYNPIADPNRSRQHNNFN